MSLIYLCTKYSYSDFVYFVYVQKQKSKNENKEEEEEEMFSLGFAQTGIIRSSMHSICYFNICTEKQTQSGIIIH